MSNKHKIDVDSLFPTAHKSGEKSKKIDVETIYINTPLNNKPKISSFSSDIIVERLKKREEKKTKYYTEMLNYCYEKINLADENGDSDTFFAVVSSIPNCKEYNQIECLEFIMKKLRDDLFNVSLYEQECCLFITWFDISQKKQEKSKSIQQTTINSKQDENKTIVNTSVKKEYHNF